jgi:hypothetical protein
MRQQGLGGSQRNPRQPYLTPPSMQLQWLLSSPPTPTPLMLRRVTCKDSLRGGIWPMSSDEPRRHCCIFSKVGDG